MTAEWARGRSSHRAAIPAPLAQPTERLQISLAYLPKGPVTDLQPGTARILLVDDEPTVRRFAVRALVEAGFRVVEAADGAEALEIVRSGSGVVDVVVSDIVMPRLDGVALLHALKASHPQLPIILMSGYAAGQLERMGIVAPCGVLVKPFPPDRLVEEVRRCLPGTDPLEVSGPSGPRL
jgi:two-component system, cell cycle sensor histidine kinase and response regulator CckA